MGFRMIDRIVSYEPGVRLSAVKQLSLCEEYLADHFPSFPVMPGVLMLEAMVQAAAWLIRMSSGDEGALHLLEKARTVRYGSFVKPGDELSIEVRLVKREKEVAHFRGKGMVDGKNAVMGKFSLRSVHLREIDPSLEGNEKTAARFFREQARVLNAAGSGSPLDRTGSSWGEVKK